MIFSFHDNLVWNAAQRGFPEITFKMPQK